MGRKGLVLGTIAAIAMAVTVATAFGSRAADPGVSAKEIVIGGTFPLTGPAALYGAIARADAAYFAYVNANGGVNGRQITFKVYDDQYNPAQTLPLTHKLVEEDKVFAVFNSLGTAQNLATRPYLNSSKVPQVLVATGDSYWGAQRKAFPWTIGFQPDYYGEAKLYGKFIRTKVPQAKIGVLVQNDAYGKNYAAGLLAGLGPAKSKIVDTETYDSTQLDVSQQIVKLKASGANVLMDFAIPNQSIGALVVATKLGWKPTIFVNSVSSSPLFMGLAAKSGASIDGVFTGVYTKNATDPTQASDPGIKLFLSIMAQYDPKDPIADSDTIYAMAASWTFVEALKNAGKTPTRAGLMRALTHLNTSANPFLLPGVKVQTSPTDYFPIEQMQLAKWQGTWRPFGHLFTKVR